MNETCHYKFETKGYIMTKEVMSKEKGKKEKS